MSEHMYERMFNAALESIAEISAALGIPEDEASCANGNEIILKAISDLKERCRRGEALASAVLTDQGGSA